MSANPISTFQNNSKSHVKKQKQQRIEVTPPKFTISKLVACFENSIQAEPTLQQNRLELAIQIGADVVLI